MRARRRWMEWGKEENNIAELYMEGSGEEMSQKDGERKAKKEDTKEMYLNHFKTWLRNSRRNIKTEALSKVRKSSQVRSKVI